MKSPSAVSARTAPIATCAVAVGRTIEQGGSERRRKSHGSGIIRLFSNSSSVANCPAVRSGNSNDPSVTAGALPGLVVPGLEVHRFGGRCER